MRIFTLLVLVPLLLGGCSEKAPEGSSLVEELTGSNAIKQGQAAKAKIEGINKAIKARSGEDVE